MKKFILSLVLFAGITFIACESDDSSNNNCVTCTLDNGQFEDSEDVCNRNGIAYVDGNNSNMPYNDYIDLNAEEGYSCN